MSQGDGFAEWSKEWYFSAKEVVFYSESLLSKVRSLSTNIIP